MSKIAVVGGGIFGTTIAIALDRAGHHVSLYEQKSDILQAASGTNQFRLHRGYHYPRSLDTAFSSKKAEDSFKKEYGDAVIDLHDHYYAIAQCESKTSVEGFKKFCNICELPYRKESLDIVNSDEIEAVFKVEESLIDPHALKKVIRERIASSNIELNLNTTFLLDDVGKYDYVINCTYANTNHLFSDESQHSHHYQYEVCEKVLLRLPEKFKNKSIVVLDGPFMCIDPYGDTDMHLMGNVVHAIHSNNTGYRPEIPFALKGVLDAGLITDPLATNISHFLESAERFIPGMKNAEHVGSFFTVRTVLPYVDHTDERPTIVTPVDEKIINVFSGKIGNCVAAAKAVCDLVS